MQTPLHLAAMGGSISIVQELVRMGASVDAVDAEGLTAGTYLVCASGSCCCAMIRAVF